MNEAQEQLARVAADRDERAREHEARREKRGETDVNYGAREDQVPAEGWVT